MIVLPGGGHAVHSAHEGELIAEWHDEYVPVEHTYRLVVSLAAHAVPHEVHGIGVKNVGRFEPLSRRDQIVGAR